MSKKTIHVLLDDMSDPGVETEADAGTVAFSLDGTDYEIDLSTKWATKLRGSMKPFIEKARVVGRTRGRATRGRNGAAVESAKRATSFSSGADKEQLDQIREWGRKNGWPLVSNRGRIPYDLRQAYEERAGR